MIANWAYVFTDLDGVEFKRNKMRNGMPMTDPKGMPILEDVTLGMVCVDAMLSSLRGDENHTGLDKIRRSDLATAIHAVKDQETEVAMKPEDIKELKERINLSGWHSLIVTKAWRMIDAAAETTKQ